MHVAVVRHHAADRRDNGLSERLELVICLVFNQVHRLMFVAPVVTILAELDTGLTDRVDHHLSRATWHIRLDVRHEICVFDKGRIDHCRWARTLGETMASTWNLPVSKAPNVAL